MRPVSGPLVGLMKSSSVLIILVMQTGSRAERHMQDLKKCSYHEKCLLFVAGKGLPFLHLLFSLLDSMCCCVRVGFAVPLKKESHC